uniref:Fork-head domain-containing protein n=1 Tax=Caenorhabditis tropicalis TaxID=1561998 RepID=A0A1I7V2J3_9PELO
MAQAQVDAVRNMAKPVKEDTKSRFLTSRTKQNSDNDYHPTHKKHYRAELPEIEEFGSSVAHEDNDREEVIGSPSKYQLTNDDATKLKKEITHLPFETILKIFAFYHHNIPITIAAAHQMRAPQLMPQTVKDMFVANIPLERETNPTKKELYKSFYMSNSFDKVVNNKTLVNFYYNEKNKIGGNWRLENDEQRPMESEERIALAKKMQASGIRVGRRDLTTYYKKKSKKHHRKHRHRGEKEHSREHSREPGECSSNMDVKEEMSPHATATRNPGDSRGNSNYKRSFSTAATITVQTQTPVKKPTFSMATSPIPFEDPSPTPTALSTPEPKSSSSSSSTTTTSSEASTVAPLPAVFKCKFEFNRVMNPRITSELPPPPPMFYPASSSSSCSSQSSFSSEKREKKKYKKKTIEELRGGIQKVYPDRERKAKKFFEDREES